MEYQHIMAAVELDPVSDSYSVHKAAALSKQFNARLTLIHAVEHMSSYGAAYGIAAGADIEEMLLENAQKAMKKLSTEFGLSDDQLLIKVGPAKLVILEEAKRLNVDLIVMGSHGRHGVRLLLGSTTNAVIHSAKCDVLAVRVKEDK